MVVTKQLVGEKSNAHTEESAHAHKQSPRKAALASFLGSTLEYYDYVLYGTASALVFSRLFFDTSNPTLATIGSLMTFGVAYIARPLGGLVRLTSVTVSDARLH